MLYKISAGVFIDGEEKIFVKKAYKFFDIKDRLAKSRIFVVAEKCSQRE